MFANKFNFMRVASTLAVMASASAHITVSAQEPASPAGVEQTQVSPRQSVSASEIAAINERMAVMSARLQELELQAKIASKTEEIRRFKGAPDAYDDGYTPSVLDINGVDGKLWATLYMQGGNVQTVRVGDRVGAWVVRAITIDSVTVQRGKDSVRLAFGTYSAPPATPGLPGGGMQPPLPR